MSVPTIQLNTGQTIPQVGLGVWQVKDQAEFNRAITAAMAAGYRHFDTAQAYQNEQYLGEAWTKSNLTRQEIFITTKIWLRNFGNRHLQKSFDISLEKLQTDYVDLLLLHFPVTVLRKKAWLILQEIHASGKAKSIGVSNYTIKHLEDMNKYASITPAVNQVEMHLFLQQPELVKYCKERGIVIEAYSPLAHARNMDSDIIKQLAAKHNKSYAQIMLRWCIEQGVVVLPKSITPSRIQENIDIFDFILDAEDAALLKTLNKNMHTCWDPTHVP